MTKRLIPHLLILCRCFAGLALLAVISPALAQPQCGVASTIDFPVDRSLFQLAQAFGVPSPRHQGRYHTGEDYHGGRGTSYGQPVRAAADGRVTYSAAWGWGRDGGVVIIEHTFPDGSVAYSQYGHLEERPDRPLPGRYTCVKAGDIIGSVGDVRPAPHLHFEIRINQPDVPGPGYTWDVPTALGWRHPSAFILNWGAWFQPAHRWHVELSANLRLPPVELADHSLVYLDANRLRRITPDGRILWRVSLERTAVGLAPYDAGAAVIYADGAVQAFGLVGAPGTAWTVGLPLERLALAAGSRQIFQARDGGLAAVDVAGQALAWRLEGLPPVVGGYAAPGVLAFLTDDSQLLAVSPDGALLGTFHLREPGSFSAAPSGGLAAYTRGGLWHIGGDGVWSLVGENTPPGGAGSGVLMTPEGAYYLLSRAGANGVPALHAYDRTGAPRWITELPDMTGGAAIERDGGTLLLVGAGGDIIALRDRDGAACGAMRVSGGGQAWHSRGADGLLRVGIGAQFMGVDWRVFTDSCG